MNLNYFLIFNFPKYFFPVLFLAVSVFFYFKFQNSRLSSAFIIVGFLYYFLYFLFFRHVGWYSARQVFENAPFQIYLDNVLDNLHLIFIVCGIWILLKDQLKEKRVQHE